MEVLRNICICLGCNIGDLAKFAAEGTCCIWESRFQNMTIKNTAQTG